MRKYSTPGFCLVEKTLCLQEDSRSRKAVEILRSADVILFDADVDRKILHYATHIPKVYLGKRKGRSHYSPQEISKLVVKLVRRCGKVIWLGSETGEEAACPKAVIEYALQEGIRVEVVSRLAFGVSGHPLQDLAGRYP